jgi:small subunit ribosomal protein S14
MESIMAKKSAVNNNNSKRILVAKEATKRSVLKTLIMKKDASLEERFAATLKLASMPRNGAKNRIRNRCEVTGRPRAYYRKMKMSRIALRDLGNAGLVPGLLKSSW